MTCIGCRRVQPDGGTWPPGWACVNGMLAACSVQCAVDWCAQHANWCEIDPQGAVRLFREPSAEWQHVTEAHYPCGHVEDRGQEQTERTPFCCEDCGAWWFSPEFRAKRCHSCAGCYACSDAMGLS